MSTKVALWRYDLLNKPQRQSLGKRHTNTRTLGTRGTTSTSPQSVSRSAIATGQNPSIAIGKAPANPTPIPAIADKWVQRTYSCVKLGTATTSPTPAPPVEFLNSSFGCPGPYYIDKIQVWKLGTNDQLGLSASVAQGNITDLGADSVVGNDFGSAMAIPGVTFKIPLGHAKQIPNTGTTTLVSCTPVAPLETSSAQTYVCHMTVWVAI